MGAKHLSNPWRGRGLNFGPPALLTELWGDLGPPSSTRSPPDYNSHQPRCPTEDDGSGSPKDQVGNVCFFCFPAGKASFILLSLPGAANTTILYVLLPLAALLVLLVPTLVLLALWIHRKSQGTPPAAPEPATNNSLQPDAVHLIRNFTHGDAEQGPGEEEATAKAGRPPGTRPSCGLPKTDISNEERAKLNRLNAAPALPRPLL